MTKNQISQELEKEFAKGNLKPSQLKRSKSLGDIPVASPLLATPLKRTLSQPESPKQPNLNQQITQLKDKLAFTQQTCQNYLTSLQKTTAELDQKEQQLEKVNADWLSMAEKNVAYLKEWQENNAKIKQLSAELEETITDATEEINKGDNKNLKLQKQLTQVKTQINSLQSQLKLAQKDLDLHQRAAEVRVNKPQNASLGSWWDYAPLFALLGIYCLAAWLFGRKHYD